MLRPLLLLVPVLLPAAEVTVVVDGLRNDRGSVYATLFAAPGDGFPEDYEKGLRQLQLTPASATVAFHDVPPGTYAVVFFHDENGNGEFDKNIVGYPKEGWGVTRDARPHLRAPRFDECAVQVTGDTVLHARMGY